MGDNDACLGFFNVKTQEWECEDECLTKEGNTFCGDTDHLTSFALLLGGANGSDGCGSNDDFVIAYISIGFIVFAIFIVIISVGINELAYRIKDQKKQSLMRIIQSSSLMQLLIKTINSIINLYYL